ncbi:MAG: MFS transporter [Methylobacteriaceae bacterium]|nr:MFS transporter [Methylobacteriaceae bacterium]
MLARWSGAIAPYLDRRVVVMLALGFSSGLPLLLVLGTFTARLAFSGIDVKAIGLFSYVALPYTLKFLWAPVIDRFDVPLLARLLGRRRAWMVATQLAVAVALTSMAFADPATSLVWLGLGAFLVAFTAASQDVVIDGWRIDAAGTELQGVMAATSNLGYRFGLIVAGAGALLLADSAGWTAAYLTMAALMVVGLLAALCAPKLDRDWTAEEASARRWSFQRAVRAPLDELYGRFGLSLVAILILVALYRMPDFVSGVMANPLYRATGYSLTQIAAVTKLYGIWVGIAGGFAGGWAIARFGLYRPLVAGAFLAASSHLSMAWLAYHGPDLWTATLPAGALALWPASPIEIAIPWRLAIAISIENFCGSFAGIALIAYMSSLTTPAFAATQYALFSSLYALPGKLVAGLSGYIASAYGFPVFFALTAAIGVPVVALCLLVASPSRMASRPSARPGTEEALTPARAS